MATSYYHGYIISSGILEHRARIVQDSLWITHHGVPRWLCREEKVDHVTQQVNHVVRQTAVLYYVFLYHKMAGWSDSWISGVLLLVCLSLSPCLGGGGSCLELGFSSNLLCSSCRELKEFSLGVLEADCKKCCQAEGVASDDKVWK